MATETIHLVFPGETPKGEKFDQVIIREITGRTNKACLSSKNIKKGKALTKIISSLIDKVVTESGDEQPATESMIDNLSSYDRHMIVIDAWKMSYGKDSYVHVDKCLNKECEKPIGVKYELKDLVRPSADFSTTVTQDGYEIGFKIPNGVYECDILEESMRSLETDEAGPVYEKMIEGFCETVNGKKFVFDDATGKEINAVDTVMSMDSLTFGYDTVEQVECRECGYEQTVALPVSDVGFLFDRSGN